MKKTLLLSLSLLIAGTALVPHSTQAILPDLYYSNVTKPLRELRQGLKMCGGFMGIASGLLGFYEFRNYYYTAFKTEPSFLIPTLGIPLTAFVGGTVLLKSAYNDIKTNK